MGYQESFVTTDNKEDFNKLVERVRQLGEEHYNDWGAYIPVIITLKQDLKRLSFKAGTQFLYVAGDRAVQYDIRNFLNIKYEPYKISEYGTSGGWEDGEDMELDFTARLIYSEYMPKKIFSKGMENDFVEVEAFSFNE
jgi:hypothetical protein